MDARFLGIADVAEVPSVAVVVDVMRAFTVAAWACAQEAEKIVLLSRWTKPWRSRPATGIGWR
ncbi:hypothetical protein [Streptomyces sp. NBC_01497]|uniref:hypothetical protein n=1 Tax=Streptomyces sp. NBC_01497 TaxID=2903885 RepID=UPI002E349159|nr:hypothetical protein [Streptomyces sp. NBC_01497]